MLVVGAREYLGKVAEDEMVLAALQEAGIPARKVAWQDENIDWGGEVALLRSAWGYQQDYLRFLGWLAQLDEQAARLLNSTALVRANVDKVRQLSWLASIGAPIPTTLVIEAQHERPISELLIDGSLGDQVVIKPAVSASGHDTWAINPSSPEEVWRSAQRVQGLLERPGNPGVLVQSFHPEIAFGEIAVVFFGGQFSHAFSRFPGVVVGERRPARVVVPSPEQLQLAQYIIEALPECPTYARIDLIAAAAGPVVMEIELAEPALGLDLLADSARRAALGALVEAVRTELGS